MSINKNDCHTPNGLIQMVTFVPYVEEVPGLNLSQDTDSPDLAYSLYSMVSSSHDHFSPHPLQFVILQFDAT
jgi:hypothetical protein